jgi:hypothetical protein
MPPGVTRRPFPSSHNVRRLPEKNLTRLSRLAALIAFFSQTVAERARVELEATGERARKRTVDTVGDLTPQEAQISGVARGRANADQSHCASSNGCEESPFQRSGGPKFFQNL